MLPAQPFYRSVWQLNLDAFHYSPSSEVTFYRGACPAKVWDDDESAMVLATFELNPQQPSLRNRKVSACINSDIYRDLPCTMVNMTPLLSGPVVNTFSFWDTLIPDHIMVHVNVVKKVTEEELLRSTDGSAPYLHKPEDTDALLRSQFQQNDDVNMEESLVSLRCPLTKRKMRVPGRGVGCQHLQCFDVLAYLSTNELTIRPSWRCPVCRDLVLVQDIRVDLLTLDVLNKVGRQCDAVVLQGNGRWKTMGSGNDRDVVAASAGPVNAGVALRYAGYTPIIDMTGD